MTEQQDAETPSVLVVEDEFIIALDLSETVCDLGLRVIGPFGNNTNALTAIAKQLPDLAILDVYIADGDVFPVADFLAEAGVPIIFHSGHVSSAEMQRRYPTAQAANKPCPPDQLISMMKIALEQRE